MARFPIRQQYRSPHRSPHMIAVLSNADMPSEIGVIDKLEIEAHHHLFNRLTDNSKEEREHKFTPPETLSLVCAVCPCPFVLIVAHVFPFIFSLPPLPPSTFAIPSSSGSGAHGRSRTCIVYHQLWGRTKVIAFPKRFLALPHITTSQLVSVTSASKGVNTKRM